MENLKSIEKLCDNFIASLNKTMTNATTEVNDAHDAFIKAHKTYSTATENACAIQQVMDNLSHDLCELAHDMDVTLDQHKALTMETADVIAEENEPTIIGTCANCGADIYENDTDFCFGESGELYCSEECCEEGEPIDYCEHCGCAIYENDDYCESSDGYIYCSEECMEEDQAELEEEEREEAEMEEEDDE